MAIFFVLPPHLSLFLLSSFIRSPPSTESHAEIHRRNSAAKKPRMTFFRFISTNSDLVWNIIMFALNYFLSGCCSRRRRDSSRFRRKSHSPPLLPLVTPFNSRIAKKFPPPYFISRVSRSRSGSTMEIKFPANDAKLDRKKLRGDEFREP